MQHQTQQATAEAAIQHQLQYSRMPVLDNNNNYNATFEITQDHLIQLEAPFSLDMLFLTELCQAASHSLQMPIHLHELPALIEQPLLLVQPLPDNNVHASRQIQQISHFDMSHTCLSEAPMHNEEGEQ